jgi:hypothetical protein
LPIIGWHLRLKYLKATRLPVWCITHHASHFNMSKITTGLNRLYQLMPIIGSTIDYQLARRYCAAQ